MNSQLLEIATKLLKNSQNRVPAPKLLYQKYWIEKMNRSTDSGPPKLPATT